MTKIKIDDVEYDVETLSDHSKAQIASLNFVDQELVRVNSLAATLHTARAAYARALKQSLDEASSTDEEINIEGLGENLELE